MEDLSYQKRLVFERLSENNETVMRLNNDMKGRASFIAGASTLIVSIVTAAKFLPDSNSGDGAEYLILALVCLCSVAIYWNSALIWKGGDVFLSGTSDLDSLYDQYISQEAKVAYGNMLKDLCSILRKNVGENANRARYLDRVVWCFMVQLALLAVAIGWTSFTT